MQANSNYDMPKVREQVPIIYNFFSLHHGETYGFIFLVSFPWIWFYDAKLCIKFGMLPKYIQITSPNGGCVKLKDKEIIPC